MEDLTKAHHLPPEEVKKLREQAQEAERIIRNKIKERKREEATKASSFKKKNSN